LLDEKKKNRTTNMMMSYTRNAFDSVNRTRKGTKETPKMFKPKVPIVIVNRPIKGH